MVGKPFVNIVAQGRVYQLSNPHAMMLLKVIPRSLIFIICWYHHQSYKSFGHPIENIIDSSFHQVVQTFVLQELLLMPISLIISVIFIQLLLGCITFACDW
jgi:hypothetical protein